MPRRRGPGGGEGEDGRLSLLSSDGLSAQYLGMVGLRKRGVGPDCGGLGARFNAENRLSGVAGPFIGSGVPPVTLAATVSTPPDASSNPLNPTMSVGAASTPPWIGGVMYRCSRMSACAGRGPRRSFQ
jgi:hypothetical protein